MGNKDPFEIERHRATLAKQGDFKRLKLTYHSRIPEILNINTPSFWDKHIRTEASEFSPMAKDRINTVYNKIRAYTGKLLDVGFGRGELESRLDANKKLDQYGIDISSYAVKSAKKKLRGKYSVGEITDIPYPRSFFDVIAALEVLEHIPPSKTFKALSELKRVLKKRGTLIISVPLNEGLEKLVKKGSNPSGHLREYTPELIEAELKIVGLKVDERLFLYAFKDFYFFKKFLQKFVLKKRWEPNNVIIFVEK